jgi:monoamine oxidase
LTAAHTLTTGPKPLKVMVLEARDRIGGRNWSYETEWLDDNGQK